ELMIMRNATFHGDAFIAGPTRRFMVGAVIAAASVLHHFRRSLERAYFAHTKHRLSVPEHTKLEILVRIDAVRVHHKTCRCHECSPVAPSIKVGRQSAEY